MLAGRRPYIDTAHIYIYLYAQLLADLFTNVSLIISFQNANAPVFQRKVFVGLSIYGKL